ncbi:hypothetical protein Adt_31899 [Abeliophyllum distichum]|uniref:Uncharacterized protein n=1 Tax=Abeliophyllum distichum TaxID=126358 RepID=A0ABD1RFE9_9LAMI
MSVMVLEAENLDIDRGRDAGPMECVTCMFEVAWLMAHCSKIGDAWSVAMLAWVKDGRALMLRFLQFTIGFYAAFLGALLFSFGIIGESRDLLEFCIASSSSFNRR